MLCGSDIIQDSVISMKQSKQTSLSVGTAASTFAYEILPLGSSIACSVKLSIKKFRSSGV